MRSWLKFFLLVMSFAPISAMAQISPLPVDANTVALWNFDTDSGDQVIDIGPSPLNGVAYTTEHVAIPNIDIAFQTARKFTGQSSFIDLGVVQGSKIDFTGWNELKIEAVITLDQSATGDHIIFSSENIRFMVINNQLTGVVRQPGGLFGVVSERTLALNTIYRVGFHYKARTLILSINGRVDSSIKLDHDIQPPLSSVSRASIGGDIFAQFFPGYVDDVRINNIADIDIQGPGIELVEPASFQVNIPKPNFLINLTDDLSGVDASSIEVFLNGIPQLSVLKTETSISGVLDDELLPTILNEVKVIVSDNQGNINQKSFFFSYTSIFDRLEYVSDLNTLALWHMNDYSPGFMKDESVNERHGHGDPQYVQVAEGVFGQARQIIRGGQISFDSIRFDSNKFTLETWLRPTSNSSGEEIIFYNGQVKVLRWNGGFVRVVLYTSRGEKSYQSSDILLPVNELHHFAVSWDGTQADQNLSFYVDGSIRGKQDAISDCDFDPIPKVGLIGPGFEGLMEEMRFSDSVRTSFSVPVFDNQVINYLNLKNGTSVDEEYPVFHAILNASSEINVSSVKILLNGNLEAATSELIITSTGIDGKFSSPLQVGLNTLEISFLDNQGNQRKKSQYFFFIRKNGGSEYSPTIDTAGLWHFNEFVPGVFEDASGNGNHITNYNSLPDQGVMGNGIKGGGPVTNKLPLNCRSYTIEGYVKANEQYSGYRSLYYLNNPSSGQALNLNPSNGNLFLGISSSPVSLEAEIPLAVPVDNAYHHIAVVYDGSREYSQLLVMVDGQVKRALDFHNACNTSGNNNLSLGDGLIFSFDEFRISKSAKYSFNLQDDVSDRPVLVTTSAPHQSTVHESNYALTFSISDSDGINTTKTVVILNGIEKPVTEIGDKEIAMTSSFSASLNLINGANMVVIKAQDMKGNDQVFTQIVYMFKKAALAEYALDADTIFLYHFNEETGDFNDSASSGVTIPEGGWARVPGVLGQAVSNGSVGGNHSFGNLSTATGWTFETWRKGSYPDVYLFAGGPSYGFEVKEGKFSFSANGTTFTQIAQAVSDSEYHHYAVVADKNHPYANVYMLIDGKVVHSTKTTADLTVHELQGSPGYSLNGDSLDEMRFSKVARYELSSSL